MTRPTDAEVREMTPLQRAQHFTQMHEPSRLNTVHKLRSCGFTREEAVERADELARHAFEAWESLALTAQETPMTRPTDAEVRDIRIRRAVLDWLRDDARIAVKMSIDLDQVNKLTNRVAAALTAQETQNDRT